MGLHSSTTEGCPGTSTYVLSPFICLVFLGRVGLHRSTNEGCPGTSTFVLSPFICWYSWEGWVSTAPLRKAAQGPPHISCRLLFVGILGKGGSPQLHYVRLPRGLHIYLVAFYCWYSREGWASTAPLLKAAHGTPYVLSPFYLLVF